MRLARLERGALAMPVEGEFPAGTARGEEHRSLIAEEPTKRIKALGGGGLDLYHGRGGNAGVRGDVFEAAAHGDGTGA